MRWSGATSCSRAVAARSAAAPEVSRIVSACAMRRLIACSSEASAGSAPDVCSNLRASAAICVSIASSASRRARPVDLLDALGERAQHIFEGPELRRAGRPPRALVEPIGLLRKAVARRRGSRGRTQGLKLSGKAPDFAAQGSERLGMGSGACRYRACSAMAGCGVELRLADANLVHRAADLLARREPAPADRPARRDAAADRGDALLEAAQCGFDLAGLRLRALLPRRGRVAPRCARTP